jgi:hypothetical protein
LKMAKERGWTVVTMKNDWKTIFTFQWINYYLFPASLDD